MVDGFELSDPKTNIDKARENIGMVFQHFNLFPHMTVLENIIFAPVELGKESKEVAKKHGMALLEKSDFLIRPTPSQEVYPAGKNSVSPSPEV